MLKYIKMQNIEVKSYFKLYIKLIQHYYYHKSKIYNFRILCPVLWSYGWNCCLQCRYSILECKFKSHLYHFLLVCLREQHMIAQALVLLPSIWRTKWSSWLLTLAWLDLVAAAIWEENKWMDNLIISLSLSLWLSLLLSLSLLFSNK